MTSSEQELRLKTDLQRLDALINAMEELWSEMYAVYARSGASERGYLASEEHDWIESLLFRYLACRSSFWQMITFYFEARRHITAPELRTRAFVIGYSASLRLYYYSSLFVTFCKNHDKLIRKLNEPFHRLEIPAGTYDTVRRNLTEPKILLRKESAWEIFREEINTPDSALNVLRNSDDTYAQWIDQIGQVHQKTEELKEEILKWRYPRFTNIRNLISHHEIANYSREAIRKFGGRIYAIQGITYEVVGRIKVSSSRLLNYTGEQFAELRGLLQPGDMILTYAEGYMSNLFLPGVFKHGITYFGSPQQREAAGLFDASIKGNCSDRLREQLRTATLADGWPADCIEAVAEGVIFNSVEKLLRTHASRSVVFRPILSPQDRSEALLSIARFLNCGYDFNFNFEDASYLCCTELLYRGFNNRGAIRFDLKRRLGRATLSAEDVIRTALAGLGSAFEFVCLVSENPLGNSHDAELLCGEAGCDALRQLLGATAKK